MANYGRGQMLGSGINPESFKLDYSGFARAAETEAQGIANLGASIGGVIKEFGEAKKEQKKVDAYNKASAKAIEAAITLGGSYGITGAEETLRPFLEAYNDPNLSPIEKTALLDEGKGMIPNVFGRFDAREADAIQRAQLDARNAPPMPKQFGFIGSELRKTDKGDIYVLKGNDGLDYDPKTKLPIFDLDAFGKGLLPEVWSGGSTFSDEQGSLITPSAFFPRESPSSAIDYANSLTGNIQGNSFPTNLNVERPAPSLLPSQIESAANLDSNPLLGPRSGDNSDLSAIEAANQTTLKPRYITADEKAEAAQEPVTITRDKLSELMTFGILPKGTFNSNDTFSITGFSTGSLPQGTIVESDGQGGFKMTQGAGVGNKKEEVKQKAEELKAQQSFTVFTDLNLLEDMTKNMAPGVAGATTRKIAESIPGTSQAEIKEIIDRISATFTLGGLSAMRASNPTGGSLGNVSNLDVKLLQNQATSLNNTNTPKAFKRELVRLRNLQHEIMYGSEAMLKSRLDKNLITQQEFNAALRVSNENLPNEYLNNQGVVTTRSKASARSVEILPNEQELINKYRTQ